MTTVTAAEFNRRPSEVKRQAAEAPVIITEHNRPAFVLLRYDQYQQLSSTPTDMNAWLEMDVDLDFEIPEFGLDVKPAAL